ncbi:MAG: site-specific integrase [Candidatus Limiplasma sp.]|nr:site-specific integrase [Candidatus Limiplasma sp.]
MPKRALKQRPDGRYMCWYKGKCFYGYTSDEALSARNEYKRLLENGIREEALGITVRQYAEKWVGIYKAEVAVGTYNAYVNYLNMVCKVIGDMRMKDVTTTDIQSIYRQQIGKSGSHIRKFCATCKALFESALNDGVINRNPCAKSKRPYGEEGSHRVLEPWECDLVARMVGKHDFADAAMLMLYAGLRRGEVLAFNIDRDVDYKNGVIYVREAVAFDSNQPMIKSTKTLSGIREIPLFDPLKNALTGKHGLVITNHSGQTMSLSSFTCKWDSFLTAMETELNGCHKRWYGKTKEHKAILAAGGLLPAWKNVTIRTHDFRHSFCSMLYNADVDLKTAMKWMGHADEKMILKIYAHLSTEKEKQSALAVGRILNQRIYSQIRSQD